MFFLFWETSKCKSFFYFIFKSLFSASHSIPKEKRIQILLPESFYIERRTFTNSEVKSKKSTLFTTGIGHDHLESKFCSTPFGLFLFFSSPQTFLIGSFKTDRQLVFSLLHIVTSVINYDKKG